jgi:hypothetical protein
MNFKEFCNNWVNFCIELDKRESDKYKKGKIKGKRFEEKFYKILSEYVPKSYRIAYQKKIKGVDYKFDFLFIKSDVPDFYDIDPSKVLAVFEVKAHGIYGYDAIRHVKSIFEDVKRTNPQIKLFYVTFKETNTYDRKVREIFGNLVQHYYRLSDSGDGLQMPPPRYFPNEWNRLMKNLSALKEM